MRDDDGWNGHDNGMGIRWLALGLVVDRSHYVLVLAGLRWTWQHEEPRQDNALDILKQRYARGEIGKRRVRKSEGRSQVDTGECE